MKKVIVSVINDLVTDQRVHKVCTTLQQMGFEVLLVGRVQASSRQLDSRSYQCHRMKLLFEKGPLFYVAFNFRLFIFLLFHRAHLLVSNDLDTLLPNFLISKLRSIPLVYDTHEIFTEVPELQTSSFKKKAWTALEQFILPKLKYVFTVNQSIAEWYKNKYAVQPRVVRNIPRSTSASVLKSRAEVGLPSDKKIIIMQGSGINMDRGGEETVEAMQFVNNALLLIIGGGDVIEKLKSISKAKGLEGRIKFLDKLPYAELMHYTRNADVGLTLDKDTNINYRFSLPNKLFDYIHGGIAVLSSRLVEIEKIISQYSVGDFIEHHSPEHIAEKINFMLENEGQLAKWKENTKLAARELTWENEEKELTGVYSNFL